MNSKRFQQSLPQLGDLELAVLNLLWDNAEQSAKDLHQQLQGRSGLNTVQSALDRLYKKGLLSRNKQSHAYLYSPKVQRSELASTLINAVVDRLQMHSLEPVLSSFVDYAEGVDDETLGRLERMIQERRRQRMQDND